MTVVTKQEERRIRDHFETLVNQKSRAEMVTFLSGHFRYNTLSSWNKSTSYAHCIKLHHGLGIPPDIDDTKYDMVFNQEWINHMRGIMDRFDEDHCHNWQVGTNGRSSGYLVLYQGGIENGKIVCYPGRSMDRDEDFHDWGMDQLKAKVYLICDFDVLTADIAIDFVAFCRTYEIVEKTIMVPKKIQVLREKSS